jgi:hypothetical protein
MKFNYLTNSSGFTRITAYVGQLLDGAVDRQIEELSQQLRPPCDLPRSAASLAASGDQT